MTKRASSARKSRAARMPGHYRRLAFAVACGLLLGGVPAAAEELAEPPASTAPDVIPIGSLVDRLLREGRIDDAEALLAQMEKRRSGDPQVRFLTGMVAMSRGNYGQAIRIFRAMLITNPEAARVRLELARAYYLDRDYVNADRQFRLVRTGNHPPDVLANIDQYLFAIRQEKNWSYSIKLALAPDTNLNAATSSHEVTLSGLPFELSDNARQRSGVGLSAEATVEFAPRIAKKTRMRFGLAAQRREYAGGEFDDMAIAAHAGPKLVSGKWDASLLATGFVRWYGGETLLRSAGGRIEATYYPSARLSLLGVLSVQTIDHARDDTRDGANYALSLGMFRPLGTTSALTARVGVNRQTAREPAHSNWNLDLSAGYLRELPHGFTIGIEPGFATARFDRALAIFGKTRVDHSVSTELSLLNRHIVLSRFTPRLSYTLTKQWSNIALYSFTRHRFEFGLTTVF